MNPADVEAAARDAIERNQMDEERWKEQLCDLGEEMHSVNATGDHIQSLMALIEFVRADCDLGGINDKLDELFADLHEAGLDRQTDD